MQHPFSSPPLPAAVWHQWRGPAPLVVEPLATTGFSGSPLWAVVFPDRAGRFVLKPLAATMSADQVAFVHGLMRHLREQGIAAVPLLVSTRDGGTAVTAPDGRRWELCSLVPGVAVPQPSARQSAAAAAVLARIHRVAAGLAGQAPRLGLPPALVRRVEQAARLRDCSWRSRRDRWSGPHDAGLPAAVIEAIVARFDRAIEVFAAAGGGPLLERCSRLAGRPCRLQPVLRDVWCDHVLFGDRQRDRVTGVVDFHAAGIDTPATDLARLWGSWRHPDGGRAGGLLDRWPEARAAYEAVRPIEADERALIDFLHATGVIFGLDNWFRWTLDDRRSFPDPARVLQRIECLGDELPHAIAAAARTAVNLD